jgi:hypothetical protein
MDGLISATKRHRIANWIEEEKKLNNFLPEQNSHCWQRYK